MHDSLPNISIIIPVLNQRDRLRACLEALRAQSYPQEKVEIIVVDNGSTDGSREVAQQYANQFISELAIKNPYHCRNLGMRAATHEYLVLLDAKCLPVPDLLRSGMEQLIKTKHPLVAGNIIMTFSTEPTIWEYLDALRFYPNHRSIQQRFGVPTGILFFKKSLLRQIDEFSTESLGGSDIEWSQRIWEIGMEIGYAAEAKVFYRVADKSGLFKKIKREGISFRKISQKRYPQGLLLQWKLGLWRYLLPARPFKLRQRIIKDFAESEIILKRFWRLWLLHWWTKLLLLYWIIWGAE
ncbi:MAG: glycosyltransferase family 2 protein [Saprospiraceae bacterium]